jgi:transposase-like protein
MRKFSNLLQLTQEFNTEQKAIDHLKDIRWHGKPYCPHCGYSVKIYQFKNNENLYKCASCRKKFTVTVGTIFEDSHISLQKWFMAIWLITSHKKGISSLQIKRDIGVTQKTAWFILNRLRFAANTKSFNAPLKNIVEVDETYIGGKERNKHMSKRTLNTQGRSTETKTPVLGLVERNGKIKAFKIDDVQRQTIQSKIIDNVVFGSKIMTDEYRSYRKLDLAYKHDFIAHSEFQYVKDDIHTNTIEGFFSLLKRSILGIYHFVSPKHIERYLAESTFRYNTIGETEENRFNLLLDNCNGRITYKELIN